MTTFIVDRHNNRDTGNTSERQDSMPCLQYVYSENVSGI